MLLSRCVFMSGLLNRFAGVFVRLGYYASLFAFFSGWSLAASAAVILQYHHVSDATPESTSISPRLFAQHLQRIEALEMQVWPLPRLVERLKQGAELPDNVVVLTFDDAYESIHQVAWPLLKQREWPFTVFVATDAVDQDARHMMSWQQLTELAQAGVTIANHTSTHTHLVRREAGESEQAWLARIEADILQAQQRLTAELKPVEPLSRLLAYPYGEYTPVIKSLIKKLEFSAFTQQSGPVSVRHDLAALPRFPMNNQFGALDQLDTKLLSLPLVAHAVEPADVIISPGFAFSHGLRIVLAKPSIDTSQLACYLSGHGRIPIQVDAQRDKVELVVKDMPELAVGRSRINCTAPSSQPSLAGRYHWFSHYWMRLKSNGDWYQEP